MSEAERPTASQPSGSPDAGRHATVSFTPTTSAREAGSDSRAPFTHAESAANSPENLAGTSFGAYQVEEEVARGGMGVIYRVSDRELGRELALKVLQERFRGRADIVRRFLEEARITGQLQHPGIVPIHELGQVPDGRPCFIMKLVRGRTLGQLLHEGAGPERLASVFGQICQTLAYAHSCGVLHRDLKPANIMVGAFGEVQVMDWGLAKQLGDAGGSSIPGDALQADSAPDAETHAGAVLGTPAYMPPEQARGEIDRMDERSDVFGLGAILYAILTGKPPYVGQNATEVLAKARDGDLQDAFSHLNACGANPDLIELARHCLQPDPAKRPASATAVDAMLVHCQAEAARRRFRDGRLPLARVPFSPRRLRPLRFDRLAREQVNAWQAGGKRE